MIESMFHHLKFIPFIIGLGLGLAIFLFAKPESQDRVVKWPHPSNAGKLIYRDRGGLCYKFKDKLVDCGTVKGDLKEYNFQ